MVESSERNQAGVQYSIYSIKVGQVSPERARIIAEHGVASLTLSSVLPFVRSAQRLSPEF